MATNKHAIIRYQALDRCFSNLGKKFYIEDLIAACTTALADYGGEHQSVSRSQIYEDINFMESEQGFRIPLERYKDGKKVYFRYSDKNFSISNQPLNALEEEQLKETLHTLSRFKGMPQFEWIAELITKVDAKFDLRDSPRTIIAFDQNQYLKGVEYIDSLYNAILYKKPIAVLYKSFKADQAQRITLHPYFLKQYNNRWFLFGLNPETGKLQNLSLDRIEDITELQIDYFENQDIDFEEYFEDIVGVTVLDNVIELVELRLSENIVPYIQTKPLHGSQKYNKDHGILTLEVKPNYELESLILSYGENIEVLNPPSLREKIENRIKMMKENYLSR